MPTYAYRCKSCGHALEAFQKMADAPLTDCPKCGEAALARQLTAVGIAGTTTSIHGKAGSSDSDAAPPPCASGACGCH